ncbi:protoheme IX farnesyltransferase, mitochondrial-like [Asterias rubens]|uniref:protoheme IX farnesyltransferase, mitochondrial-like n=1 Tax=Asterias rubens TaxID=7604 RepID=UPI001455BE6B|nr:protoheme IX farnesyltransferase, mitochondrial-like [Asterias rubens]
MATFIGKTRPFVYRRLSNLGKCELCRLHSSSGLSNQPKVTMSIHQYALTVLPQYSGLLSNLLRTQSRRSVHLCASLSQKVSKKDRVKQVTNKYASSDRPQAQPRHTSDYQQSTIIHPSESSESSTVTDQSPAGLDLHQRVETAIQSTLDHVTPCPIEPKDGNKGDTEEVVEVKEGQWKEQSVAVSQLPSLYLQLSKSRLTGLVVISALAGYGMAPGVFELSTCALMGFGTFMTSCSANTVNQYFEVPFDSQMARTRNRVLVKGLLSPLHAVGFASVVGTAGVGILALAVNPLAAAIAASTWVLYVGVYTPLKRLSIVNTWVGAVVGALPPAIGWAASTGALAPGALLMAGFLYCWQFPHFNALSWNLRSDYSRGGYRMMATTNPSLCRRVALRHCFAMIGLCTLAPMLDLTTWAFALDSLPLNLWLTYLGWRFYQRADSKSAKQLFKFTLLHLPLLMLLLLISKKSLYSGGSVEAIAGAL